ncbi:MAG: hypothetical protein BroJett011_76140 [Chloroflexota bacterium]|nr:MAG: hypothetical protein BroJett011_76140 [Chloroflexota bacterium]
MKRSKLTPKQTIVMFLIGLIAMMTMACGEPGDAMDLTCAANPFDTHCDAN